MNEIIELNEQHSLNYILLHVHKHNNNTIICISLECFGSGGTVQRYSTGGSKCIHTQHTAMNVGEI